MFSNHKPQEILPYLIIYFIFKSFFICCIFLYLFCCVWINFILLFWTMNTNKTFFFPYLIFFSSLFNLCNIVLYLQKIFFLKFFLYHFSCVFNLIIIFCLQKFENMSMTFYHFFFYKNLYLGPLIVFSSFIFFFSLI